MNEVVSQTAEFNDRAALERLLRERHSCRAFRAGRVERATI